MNCLFLSYWYPSQSNPLKGVYIKKHAHAIAANGVNMHILSLVIEHSSSLYSKEVLEFKDEKNIPNTQILIRSKYYKIFHLLLFFQKHLVTKAFNKINREFKAQIIHSNVLYPAAILGSHLSGKFQIPHVITEHWSKVNQFMSKSLYATQGKMAYESAKKITVVSVFLRDRIKQYIDLNKTQVIPNVIRSEIFHYNEKAQVADKISFTMVAHWQKPKRPDLIFESLNEFSKHTTKTITLNVIGEGTLLNELRSKTWSFQINYLGNKPADLLAEILQQSDYFLHASEIETFSIVIAEALATGTPTLASNAGAIPELINENNGILCNNSVNDWLKGLIQLTENKYDHRSISESSAKYSEKIIGNKFKEMYETVLKH